MAEDEERNATIIADQVTDLLVIGKDLFNRTLRVRFSVYHINHRTSPDMYSLLYELGNLKMSRGDSILLIREGLRPYQLNMSTVYLESNRTDIISCAFSL